MSLSNLGDSNDGKIFPHKLLLTNAQVSRFRKCFANNLSVNIKLLKPQLYKIRVTKRLLGELLGPLLKTGLPLKENVHKQLAKIILIPLGWTQGASTTDTAIHKKVFWYDFTTLMVCKW